jgi:hypothetical protein
MRPFGPQRLGSRRIQAVLDGSVNLKKPGSQQRRAVRWIPRFPYLDWMAAPTHQNRRRPWHLRQH